MQKSRGFTLLELMIAVAIIAGLATVALPAYRQYVMNSRIAECSNEVAAIRLGEEEHFLRTNTYIAGVIDGPAAIFTLSAPVAAGGLGPAYTPSIKTANLDRLPPNCTYTVILGAPPGGPPPPPGAPIPGYTVTAFGINDLAVIQAGQPYVVRFIGP